MTNASDLRPRREPLPVLVSACLAGCECRFDGSSNLVGRVADLAEQGRAVLVCPEEDGGCPLPGPRPR